jgi:hypothetical protein
VLARCLRDYGPRVNGLQESPAATASGSRSNLVAQTPGEARARLLRRAVGGLLSVAAVAAYARLSPGMGDFAAFWDVGGAALARGDIYAQGPTMRMYVFYPPHFSLVMMPFALLPRHAAACAWFALKLGALVLLVRWVAALLKDAAPGLRGWKRAAAVALPFVILINPFNGEIWLGQVNVFVLFASAATMVALERRQPWRAAIAFSFALVKATPWVFIPWFVMRRQWSFLARLACVSAAWLAALALWYGPGRVVPLFQQWLHLSRSVKMSLDSMAYFENQSLAGVAARLAVAFPALQRQVLGVAAHELLWMGAGTVLFAVLLAVVRRDGFRPALPATEFAYLCVVMMLFGPDTRWAHQVQLLVPLAVITAIALRTGGIPWLDGTPAVPGAPRARPAAAAPMSLRRLVQGVLAMGLVVLVVLTRDIVGKPLDNALRDARLHFAYLVVLAAALAAVLIRHGWLALSVERLTARSARS